MLVEDSQTYYLTIGTFSIVLSKQLTLVFLTFETQITYILPNNNAGFIAIVVSMVDDNWAGVNNMIAAKANLMSKQTLYGS
jgi:hypothetical protein